MENFSLASRAAVLDANLRVQSREMGPEFYEHLDRDFDGFRGCTLITEYTFTADWPTWERHPMGDEMLYLVSGAITLLIRASEGEQTVELDTPGNVVIVPKGCWHTGKVRASARVLFITPGEGTENRESPDA